MPDNKKKKQKKIELEQVPDVPVVDPIDIEEIEFPELSEEQMRELAARRKLQGTGPVVNGRSGRLGASLPVGGAAPRLSSPVDPMVLPRYNVNIPSGAAQPASVVAPAVAPNLRAPQPVYSDAGMIAAANERASRMATPQAAPSVQVDPLVMQRQKMAGIQGKQAYDTAAAGSRIAAGQEKLDRMVQSTPSPYSGGISGTSMQRDKMNGQAIAEAERLEAIRQQMIADQQAIGRERMERMAQQTSSAPIGSSDTSIQNEKLAGIQSNQEYQRQLEADALGKAAAQERLDRMVQPIQETEQAQQNYNLFGNSKQQGYPGTATTHKQQEDQQKEGHDMLYKSKPQNQFNGDPNSSTAGMDYLNSLYTDPWKEERLRKASAMNQRILAIGDAIRHIGNIANTVGYAPAQQFNNPIAEEQARYEKGKALRDRANQQYYTYQQQKEAQDAAQRKWEQQFGLQKANLAAQNAYRQGQLGIAAENAANRKAYQEGSLALRGKQGEARQKELERHNKVVEGQGRERIGISKQNSSNLQNYRQWRMNGGGSGSGVAPLDTPNGQITPNGKNYSNQLLQMFDYAKSKGYVQESDVAKRLREMGFGKDQSDNVKRQMVMDLLRTNQDMGDYASSRLGWTYGTGGGNAASDDMDLGLDGEDDEMDLGLE